MSTTPPFRLKLLAPVVAFAALALGINACSTDEPTGSSTGLQAPSVVGNKIEDRLYDADGDGHLSKAEKEARKAAKQAQKREFELLVNDWKAYKAAIKKGNIRAELLRCEPEKRQYAGKLIGPNGGRIGVGRHELIVPAGAVADEVFITATVLSGPVAQVEFEPHGLEFLRPVQLDMNYEHCIVPEGFTQGIVYIDNGFKILEERPSFDDDDLRTVSGWLDHFSGYAISTGRARE